MPRAERDEDATALRAAVQQLGGTGTEDRCELLVTHNFVIGWFVRRVLQAPEWRWIGLNSANYGLTIVAWDPGRSPEVLTYNDTGHL